MRRYSAGSPFDEWHSLSLPMTFQLLLVVLGGGLGSGLRFLVAQAVPSSSTSIPWPTVFVNLLGSFVLGVFVALADRAGVSTSTTLVFIGTGLCGGFTTFSAFSVETLQMLQSGHYGLAIAYVAGSILGGIGLATLGWVVVRSTTP